MKNFRCLLLASLLLSVTSALCAQPAPKQLDRAPATATVIPLSENWRLDGDVPVHALLLSLQGLANRDYPRLYLEYPKNWQWEIVHPLMGFLEKRHGLKFDRLALNDADTALKRFGQYAKGCVVWDKTVRSSLIVAFTIAGVEDLVVVNADQLDLAARHGLKVVVDLRGKFTRQPDHAIYQWAFDHYHARCSRDYYVVMGGHSGAEMQPGIADFGISRRAFFTDLSANPQHPEELALLKRILAGQNPASIVLGWHSYAKDTEEQWTTLLSGYGLKMEGLHNLPNLSFNCQFTFTPGFKFVNNHHVARDAKLVAEAKVYLSFVQSDSIGIGVWTKPGRGKLPFAWQVTMNWTKFSPAALEYFHESATPNDTFIGGLSGPGYMYPNHIPADRFPGLMREANEMMRLLDERVMEIMDNSAADGNVGNADLTKETVDRYYAAFPDVIGFINGYGPARTRDLRGTQALISYDYYIDPRRPREEVAADLNELIALNAKRPYYLLVHVRESNDVNSLVEVVKRLEGPVEVVPIEVFLKLAASNKTYTTRYQDPNEPKHFKGYK
jgi:hypothetical protein